MSGLAETTSTAFENAKTDIIQDEMAELQEPLLPPETLDIQPMTIDTDIEDGVDDSLLHGNHSTDVNDLVQIDESGWDHGAMQPRACRDWFWGLLFLLQLVTVVTLGIMGLCNLIRMKSEWFPPNDNDKDDHDDDSNRQAALLVLSIAASSIGLSVVFVNLLLGPFAPMLIQISLVASPLMLFVTFVVSFVSFNPTAAFFALAMSIMGIFYAYNVWHKVPFASANLKIALKAAKDNHGLWIVAYGMFIKAYLWILCWSCATYEIFFFKNSMYDCLQDDENFSGEDCTMSTKGRFAVIGMLLSFFWTSQVLKNIFHTTIAGVVGTWWFDPEDAQSDSLGGRSRVLCGFCGCTPAIFDSWSRSALNNFGSICLGSFLVSILQVLQFLIRCGRKRRDEQRRRRGLEGQDLMCCMLQFVVDSLESLLEYFNTWAFVYVGLYGYDYLSAGKQVSNLFKARGWNVIINDHLVHRALGMMSMFVSVITGLTGFVLGFCLMGISKAIPSFLIGFVLGASSCQILFGVVTSGVNTIVVCFAESPNQLRENHGDQIFLELVQAWRKAYPQECGF